MSSGWADPIPLLLLAGGLVGGLLRATLGQQKTLSGRTVLSAVNGGVVAVIAPQVVKWAAGLELVGPPVFWLSAGLIVGLFGDYIIVAALWRAGVFKGDVRADKPPD